MNRRISVPMIVSALAAAIVTYGAVTGLAAVTSNQPTQAAPVVVTQQAIPVLAAGSTATSPVANDDSYTVTPGATLTVAAPGVLANDTNASLAIPVTAPMQGSLTLLRTGRFIYDPQGTTGTVTFTYKASDGTAMSNNAVVTITIAAGAGTATGNTPGTGTATGNTPGPNGSALYKTSCQGCHGADGNSIAKAQLGPTSLSNAQLVSVLSPGAKMGAYTATMSAADIQAVADYVGTLGVSTPTPTVPPAVATPTPSAVAAPSAGSTLFSSTCAGCHSKANLAGRGISDANLVTIMTSGAMKFQAANLSAADIKAVAAFINTPAQGPATPGTPTSTATVTGESAYTAFCAACHGPTGSGTSLGPDIVGESRSEIIEVVRKGDGTMPAFSATAISDKTLAALATYMGTFPSSGESEDDEDGHTTTVGIGDGATVYTSFCAACHGPNGRGTPFGPDIVGDDSSEIFKVVRNGDGSMPAFSFQTLSDKELTALADYISSWGAGDDHDGGDSGDKKDEDEDEDKDDD